MKEVIFQQLIYKDDLYYNQDENKPFTGVAFEPNITDNPLDLSKKISTRTFLDGKLDGLSTWFSPIGDPRLRMEFKKGEVSGLCEQFRFIGNGTYVLQKLIYKDGELDGVCKWYSTEGRLMKKETYKKGLLHGPRVNYYNYYHKGHRIKKIGNFYNGVPDGEWETYNAVGRLERTGQYKKGRRHGLWEWFYQDSQPMENITYNWGKKHGPITCFFRNFRNEDQSPTIQTKGINLNNKREGIWERFHPNGKILCRATYANGVITEWEWFDASGKKEEFLIPHSNIRRPYLEGDPLLFSVNGDPLLCDIPF